MEPDEIMTITEISHDLKVPVNTLRFWRSRGTGPRTFRLGGRVVAKRADVNAWIESQYAADQGGVSADVEDPATGKPAPERQLGCGQ